MNDEERDRLQRCMDAFNGRGTVELRSRAWEVMYERVVKMKSAKEAGAALHIAEATVEVSTRHIAQALNKGSFRVVQPHLIAMYWLQVGLELRDTLPPAGDIEEIPVRRAR